MVEASSISQQDSSLPTVDDLSTHAPVHSGTAATLHGSGPTCDLLVYHSEVDGGSKVDLLSASDGTLSTVKELSLLGPSPILGRLDPLKVKHNSRFITRKKSPYKLSDFISVTTDFLGGLTSRVGSGSAAAGLVLPGVVAPVSIHKLKKKSNK